MDVCAIGMHRQNGKDEMTMMKKLLALLLALVAVATFSACKKEEDEKISNLEAFRQQDVVYTSYTDPDTKAVFSFESVDTDTVKITGYTGPTEMHDVKIPATVQTGADAATSTKKVIAVGAEAFKAISSIKNVIIPEGIETIEKYAFADCVQMASVSIPASIKTIEEGAFRNNGIATLVFPETCGLTEIAPSAFSRCFNLKELTVPAYIKTIGVGAFFECTSLEKLILSEGVETVGNQAFQGTTALAHLDLPSTFKNTDPLEDLAFSGSDVLYRENIKCPADSAAEDYANRMVLSDPEDNTQA